MIAQLRRVPRRLYPQRTRTTLESHQRLLIRSQTVGAPFATRVTLTVQMQGGGTMILLFVRYDINSAEVLPS